MSRVYDPREALLGEILKWPQANQYKINTGWIDLEPGSNLRRFPPPNPFADPDLFLSFARLGRRGDPSESRIKSWVTKYGLLTRKDELRDGAVVLEDGRVNQAPMTVRDFRLQVARARDLLNLYAEIRSLDTAAIKARFEEPQSAVDREFSYRFSEDNPSFPSAGIEALMGFVRHTALPLADKFLADSVTEQVAKVRLRAVRGFAIPPDATEENLPSLRKAALKYYRPGQSWQCPDLLSAMYLQFYLLVTRNEPIRHCDDPACRMPFPATRKDRRFCNDSCRSNGRDKD